jgi:hypothetical protein
MDTKGLVRFKKSIEFEIGDFIAEKIKEFNEKTSLHINEIDVNMVDISTIGEDASIVGGVSLKISCD